MKAQFKRDPQEVRKQFEAKGLSIARWAAEHGVSSNQATAVLRGERKCVRGECHKIAVLMGIKDEQIVK